MILADPVMKFSEAIDDPALYASLTDCVIRQIEFSTDPVRVPFAFSSSFPCLCFLVGGRSMLRVGSFSFSLCLPTQGIAVCVSEVILNPFVCVSIAMVLTFDDDDVCRG